MRDFLFLFVVLPFCLCIMWMVSPFSRLLCVKLCKFYPRLSFNPYYNSLWPARIMGHGWLQNLDVSLGIPVLESDLLISMANCWFNGHIGLALKMWIQVVASTAHISCLVSKMGILSQRFSVYEKKHMEWSLEKFLWILNFHSKLNLVCLSKCVYCHLKHVFVELYKLASLCIFKITF